VSLRKLLALVVLDCLLIPAVLFLILLVGAADQPTRTEKIIVVSLFVLAVALAVALISLIVLVVRRLVLDARARRFAKPS
jgi:ABC-type dipeptide/oligopeptide/nickel transport system permease subunit